MSLSKALLPELDQEMAKTRKVLERLPLDRFDWKPHEKSFSLGELGNHVARLVGWGLQTMKTDSFDMEPQGGSAIPEPAVARDVDSLLIGFDQNLAEFRRAVEEASDEALMAPWTFENKGKAIFTLPRIAVLRSFVMNHMIHHRGQLSVYLRMNDVPVPSIYGPSADEAV